MKKKELNNYIKELENTNSVISKYVENLNQRIDDITKYSMDLRRELDEVKQENVKLHSTIVTVIPGKIETRVEAATDEMTDIFNDRVEKLESFEKKVTEFEKTIDVLLEQNKVLSSITDSHAKTIKGIESDVQSNWESTFRCDCSMSSDLETMRSRVSILEEKFTSIQELDELRELHRIKIANIVELINSVRANANDNYRGCGEFQNVTDDFKTYQKGRMDACGQILQEISKQV